MNIFFLSKALAKSQRGQALPVGLAFIMFGALLTLTLFNTGQMASEKSRLINTADAAVYSGLIWQTRALNFQAYTNRAMVANQVTIAQLVSVTSWANYGRITARNLDNTIGWIPPLKPFTAALEQAMTKIEDVVTQVANTAVPIIDSVNRTLSQSQRALYVATFAVTPSLVREVVKANDSRYSVSSAYAVASLGQNLRDWQNFSSRYDDKNGLHRKADLVNRSKDGFTNDRGWSVGKFYLGPTFKLELIKEGSTNLIYAESASQFGNATQGEWEWKAKDNISLHVQRFRCGWSGCGWRHSEIPIGWGGAYVENDIEECETRTYDSGDSQYTERICPEWMRRNQRGERLSNSAALQIEGSYSGVQAYYDLKDLSQNNRDPRLSLRIEVQLPSSAVRTSAKLDGVGSSEEANAATVKNGFGQGVFDMEDKHASDSMASIASGEIYFERPAGYQLRVNGSVKQEHGSLYNPYWKARLVSIPTNERMAAWILRSPGLASASTEGAALAAKAYAEQQQEELQSLQDYAEQGQLAEIIPTPSPLGDDAGTSLMDENSQNIIDAGSAPEVDAEQYLESINDQIAEMKQQRDNTESSIRAEYQSAYDSLQTEIDSINNSLDGQVQELFETIQNQIDGLVAEQASLVDPAEIEQLQQQIDIQTERLSLEPQQLRQQLEDSVDDLLSRQQQIFDDFDSVVVSAQNDIDSQIASLEEQLAYIEEGSVINE